MLFPEKEREEKVEDDNRVETRGVPPSQGEDRGVAADKKGGEGGEEAQQGVYVSFTASHINRNREEEGFQLRKSAFRNGRTGQSSSGWLKIDICRLSLGI